MAAKKPSTKKAGTRKATAKKVTKKATKRPGARAKARAPKGAGSGGRPERNVRPESGGSGAIDSMIGAMDPAFRDVVEAIRRTTLGADREITEGVKWNGPSFYLEGWFATVNVRGRGVMVVLHQGAKKRPGSGAGLRESLGDASGMLRWHSDDRATATFVDQADFDAKRRTFAGVVRAWATEQRRLARG